MNLDADIDEVEMPEQGEPKEYTDLEKVFRKQAKAAKKAGMEIDQEAVDEGI